MSNVVCIIYRLHNKICGCEIDKATRHNADGCY